MHRRRVDLLEASCVADARSDILEPSNVLLSPRDVGRTFNRSTRTIRNWTRAGILKPVRIGKAVFYRVDDVRALIIQGVPQVE